MVILTQDLDGFGNHLLLTSHFLVNVAEHRYELAIPSFERYAPFFEGTVRQDFDGLPVRLQPGPRRFRVFFRALRLRWGGAVAQRAPWLQRLLGVRVLTDHGANDVDLNSSAYLTAAHTEDLLVHGWQFRDKRHFAQNGDLLRRIFRPIAAHRRAVEHVLTANRQAADVLVGVHIRRGDYAGWHGGAYLYDNATFVRAMQQMQALFPATTRVRFLLFSNETIADADFAAFDTGRSTNHAVEDLYAMAGCDYIIGPLSTYSMWASFYGRVPLCHLHRPDQPIASLREFMVFEDQPSVRWESSLA
ncbi:alpha-1,2-fucosyltransferase [Hymenobacter daecheongensis]|nr:alpha-1,2-fucosyltransferase [Hymenobacter daecheongensis]